MARISKKAKIEPVREANELAVENVIEKEEVKAELSIKDQILADVKKMCIANEEAGYSQKVKYEEVEVILNKYL